jgi:glycosyltransferase involved in cell wall biosynthesis
MPRWYQACDVFVLPSWAEGLSLAVLEAMACARPVVTTWPDRAGHDAIQDGQNGLLVPYGQEDALAQALISLAEQPEAAAALGRAARETARSRFTWPEIAGRTLEVYREVLDQRRPGS